MRTYFLLMGILYHRSEEKSNFGKMVDELKILVRGYLFPGSRGTVFRFSHFTKTGAGRFIVGRSVGRSVALCRLFLLLPCLFMVEIFARCGALWGGLGSGVWGLGSGGGVLCVLYSLHNFKR